MLDIRIRAETPGDVAAREALLDRAFGEYRFDKPSERLRRGRLPAEGLALVATDGARIVGTLRLWGVVAAGRSALLLGPLAVDPGWRQRGIGSALMRRALGEAERRGHKAVLLVGDAAYYARFGFAAGKAAALKLAGNGEPERLLALELMPGALDGAHGQIAAGLPARPRRAGASRSSLRRLRKLSCVARAA